MKKEPSMRVLLLLFAVLSFPASAQVYKWVDENGVTHFGSQPPPGQQKPVDVKPASGGTAAPAAESDIIRQARELEQRRRAERVEQAQKQYRRDLQEIETRIENRPDYVCTGAENRLKNWQERWEDQKRQGYSLSDQRYYEQRIKEAQRSRDNLCR